MRLSNRVGKLRISSKLLQDLGESGVSEMMEFLSFFPYRAEHHFSSDTFEIIGYSPRFEVLSEGSEAPFYMVYAERLFQEETNKDWVFEVSSTYQYTDTAFSQVRIAEDE